MKHTVTLFNLSAAQLLAVSTALDATTHAEPCFTPCTQPEEVAQAEAADHEMNTLEVLLEALTDPRYELRSEKSLAEKAGILEFQVQDILTNASIAYFTKTRRSDGATLIGLYKEPVNAEQPAPQEAPTTQTLTPFGKLMELLEDPRYVWRTVTTLVEKTGYRSRDEILDALSDNDVYYDTADRSSDGAPIIALSSRT